MSRNEKDFFNELAASWDDTRATDATTLTELIAQIGLQAGDHVLDAGCGTGVLIPYLAKAVGDNGLVLAVDVAPKMIKQAVRKWSSLKNVDFLAGDIQEFSPGEKFDAVICLNFFPHITDKPLFARNMYKLLGDQGKLVIMHDRSRAFVNGIHQQCEAVANDRLPACSIVAAMLKAEGYRVEVAKEDDRVYFVQGQKMLGLT